MIKEILVLLILCSSLKVTAQSFSKRDFVKTNWFSDNSDSLFFKSDTIRLIQRTNPAPDWDDKEYAEYEMEYLNHGDYVNLKFNRFGKLQYWGTTSNYINAIPMERFSWKFNAKDEVIEVLKDYKIVFKLKPVSIKEVEIKSRFSEREELLKTKELTLLRIKNEC